MMKAAIGKSKITPLERITFFRTLSMLLRSGIHISAALDEMTTDHHNLQSEINRITSQLKSGNSFAQAVTSARILVPDIAAALIRSGDETGQLHEVLETIARYFEHQYRTRQESKIIFIYPVIVICAAFLSAVFLSTTIIPQISDIYKSSQTGLPLITKVVFWIGRIFLGMAVALLTASPLAIVPRMRQSIIRISAHFGNSIPGLRNLRASFLLSIWSQSLDLLCSAGLPLTEALRIAQEPVANTEFAGLSTRLIGRIEQGLSIGEAIRLESCIPSLVKSMVDAGDRSGNLPESFRLTALFYRNEYELASRRMMAVAEPAAVLAAGLFVALLALAVLLPIADLGALAQ